MRTTPVLATLAVLLAAALARAQYILNPKTYTSQSGEYELFVDPTEREGVGPATMTMSRNGRRLWERRHGFSLWHAHVTNDGRTIGYTYIHGRQGMTSELGRGVPNTVDIVFFDAAGNIAARHAIERRHPAVMANPPAPYEPLVNLLVPIPAHDLLIVKLQHTWDRSPEGWLLYNLTTGEHLKTIDNPSVPEFEEEYGFTKIFSIQPIGDLPLVARHAYVATFQDANVQTDSAHISVLDLDGNQLWQTTIHNEYRQMERGWWWHDAHKHTDQLATTPDGFTFHSWSAQERTAFACERAGESWAIAQTGRERAPFKPHTESRAALETISLELAGAIDLGAPRPSHDDGPDERAPHRPLHEIRTLATGPNGHFYAVSERDATIHIFDSAGRPVRALPAGAGVARGIQSITVGSDGSIYGQSMMGDPVRYDPDGKPAPPLGLVIDTFSEQWAMQPGSNRGWAIGYEHAALFEIKKDDTLHVIRSIHRRPDNTWIGRANNAAVAGNGALALIASGDVRLMSTTPPRLCVYDANGEPINQYDMPDQLGLSDVAFVWPYVITLENGRDRVVANLYDVRDDAPARRVAFPGEIEINEHFWAVHPSPNPGEFLLRSSGSLKLLRIRLPDEPEPHK